MNRKEVVEKYLNSVIGRIADQQIELGLFASGKSIQSLTVTANEDGTGKLTGDESLYYQIHGRAPGNMPPINKMIEWIAVKRLQISPWAVAMKIKKHGTAIFRGERKGLNIKVAMDKDRPEFLKDMTAAVKKEFVAKIKSNINNA